MLFSQFSENKDQDITSSLTECIKKDNHPLDLFVKRVVGGVLSEFVVPWFVDCLQKYKEQDFHQRMDDQSWDFIGDWKQNHPRKFKAFIFGARRLRYAYDFDSKVITEQVVNILEQNGWKISHTESVQLYFTAQAIKQMIEE